MQIMYFGEMLARQRMDELMREAERERTMRERLQVLERGAEGADRLEARERGRQPVGRAGLGWR